MSGLDQTDTASRCARGLPTELTPERLTPQVSSSVRSTSGPAKPANTPIVQWGHFLTARAVAVASCQPSSFGAVPRDPCSDRKFQIKFVRGADRLTFGRHKDGMLGNIEVPAGSLDGDDLVIRVRRLEDLNDNDFTIRFSAEAGRKQQGADVGCGHFWQCRAVEIDDLGLAIHPLDDATQPIGVALIDETQPRRHAERRRNRDRRLFVLALNYLMDFDAASGRVFVSEG